jgi:prepilin-type N-terminal cleavage/methylation domain-containing protein/prepilin-type processing-associated H-X9-DG protein
MNTLQHLQASLNESRWLCRSKGSRGGLTLIELLVALAIIGLLVALTIPAVQSAREAARRADCTNKLRQISLGCLNYESAHGAIPPGTCGLRIKGSFLTAILPQLDKRPLYDRFFSPSVDPSSDEAVELRKNFSLLLCPGDRASQLGDTTTNYCGNFGTGMQLFGPNGLFRYPRSFDHIPNAGTGPVRVAEVTDGMSNTVMLSEQLIGDLTYDRLRTVWSTPEYYNADRFAEFKTLLANLPPVPTDFGWDGDRLVRGKLWTHGDPGFAVYFHILPPNQPSAWNYSEVPTSIVTATSGHPGGVNVAFGDGRVQFVSSSVSSRTWEAWGSRAGSESP